MNSPLPLDVLVVVPTMSELRVVQWLLFARVKWGEGTVDVLDMATGGHERPRQVMPLPSVTPDFTAGRVGDLNVGLLGLGGAGNVRACSSAAPFVSLYKPAVVILLGIAAAASTKDVPLAVSLVVGDVICNKSIYYYSFGKVTETVGQARRRNASLRGAERRLRKVGLSMEYRDAIHTHVVPDADLLQRARLPQVVRWHEVAKVWFSHIKTSPALYEALGGLDHPWINRERWSFPDIAQLSHDAKRVDIASGELVLASGSYQAMIDAAIRAKLADSAVSAFEMEAYGVASLRHTGPRVLTVRGISDFGDGAKSLRGRKDTSHLAATCLATAYLKAVLEGSTLTAITTEARAARKLRVRYGPHGGACLDHATPVACPHTPFHSCVTPGLLGEDSLGGLPGRAVPLVRLFEEVEPAAYSDWLRRLLGALGGEEQTSWSALFLYPYSLEETVRFCEIAAFGQAAEDGVGLAERVKRVVAAETRIREAYPHFTMWEGGPGDGGTAKLPVLRCLVGQAEVTEGDESSRQALFSVLFGDRVRRARLAAPSWWGVPPDDVTLLQRRSAGDDGNPWRAAIRYISRSKLLVIQGWPCSEVRGGSRHRKGLEVVATEWGENIDSLVEGVSSKYILVEGAAGGIPMGGGSRA